MFTYIKEGDRVGAKIMRILTEDVRHYAGRMADGSTETYDSSIDLAEFWQKLEDEGKIAKYRLSTFSDWWGQVSQSDKKAWASRTNEAGEEVAAPEGTFLSEPAWDQDGDGDREWGLLLCSTEDGEPVDDQSIAEALTAEHLAALEAAKEEAPAEETPVEDAPAEDAPAEEAATDEAPAEEAPADEAAPSEGSEEAAE